MSNILITGANGMLGKALCEVFPNANMLKGKTDLDLSNPNSLPFLNSLGHYEYIIHTAAITNMQNNELYPDKAYHLHSEIIQHLQKITNKLIYISAQGRNSKGVYFKSKIDGENSTLTRPKDLVIRTNIVGNGGLSNWALSSLKDNNKINGYTNSFFNPVHVNQLSECIKNNLSNSGIINVCSDEVISKYSFIKKLANSFGYNEKLISPIKLEDDQDLTVLEQNNTTFKYSLPYENIFYS